MKIAFISGDGSALDIAFRMGLDGHKVTGYIDNPPDRDIFDGIVAKVSDWKQAVKNVDLCFFEDNKCAYIWEAVHKDIPCFGGSPFMARLEQDRAFAHALMAKAGIERVESHTFKTLKEAANHLKSHQVAHVVKPEGKMVKSHHVIIGEDEDGGDAISQIERLMDQGLQVEAVEVEERKYGVEVGLKLWFNGMDIIGPIEMSFEHKHSHNNERGFLCGETGTLIRYLEDCDIPLYKNTLARMIPTLRAANYRGPLDLNMIVGRDLKTGDKFIAPLEFTPRSGKPQIFIEDELHVTPWADLAMACATGHKAELRARYDWAVGVVLNSFGFPFADKHSEISQGLKVRGVDEHSLAHIHPIEMRLDKKGDFVTSSGEGYVLTATGRGPSIQEAKNIAYDRIKSISLPGSYFREDISDKIFPHELEELGILPIEESVAR